MVDSAAKGSPAGARHHFSKTTDDQVRVMRAAYDAGASVDEVFVKHGGGLSHSQVEKICKRESWKHVT